MHATGSTHSQCSMGLMQSTSGVPSEYAAHQDRECGSVLVPALVKAGWCLRVGCKQTQNSIRQQPRHFWGRYC